jgi:hypothetical protein
LPADSSSKRLSGKAVRWDTVMEELLGTGTALMRRGGRREKTIRT